MAKNKPVIVQFWQFLWERKLWWMTPILLMLIIVGVLIIFGESSAVSPFTYVLF